MTDKPAIDYRALLNARISGDKRPTDRATICLDPEAADALEIAVGRLDALERSQPQPVEGERRPTKLAGDPLAKARKAADEAQKAVDAASIVVVMMGLPEAEYRALLAGWKQKPEDEQTDDTDLVRRCLHRVEALDGTPADLAPEDLMRLYPHLSAGERGKLASSALRANNIAPDVDFFAKR